MTNTALDAKLKLLPDLPGVYFFKDSQDHILYIGKAGSLRRRVVQYFRKDGEGDRPHIRLMLEKVADLEVIATDSEAEAMILEANLVHEKKPRYNILLKDDKHFPYIKVTLNEEVPRLLVVRRVLNDGARYFGPYTDPRSMRQILRWLKQVFGIRECNRSLPLRPGERPCLYLQIGRCCGPCAATVSLAEYRERADQVCAILAGRTQSLLAEVDRRMAQAATEEKYEEAAILRDRKTAIEKLIERQKMDGADSSVSRDVFADACRGNLRSVAVIRIREGLVLERRHFLFQQGGLDDETEIWSCFLRQYYLAHPEIPSEILIPLELEDAEAMRQWLAAQRNLRVEIRAPQRGEKVRLLELARRNADLLLLEEMGKRQALDGAIPPAVAALQRELGMARPPRRIECFDISNLQGTDTVASMVSFLDGKPKKSEYRHFRLESLQKPDDFAAMYEVITRRVRRIAGEGASMPDLILIDGGKGQLSAGLSALRDNGAPDQAVAALAKRLDEVFVPGRDDSIMIGRTSPALRLIQRVRDEAHRFAISYHRKLRKKRTLTSELDALKGIGPKRREALLRRFGSYQRICEAALPDLETVVGKRIADLVFSQLHPGES